MFFKIDFLTISQISQENACVGVLLMKLQALGPANLLKKETPAQMFSVKFPKALRTSFFTKQLRWLLLNQARPKSNKNS